MNAKKLLNKKIERRIGRVRARIFGTVTRPRLAVTRSNQYMYAQLIDDEKGNTLVSVSLKDVTGSAKKFTKAELAKHVGELIGKRALEKGIKDAVFDRRGYSYHGRVKAVAEGARSSGLKI